MPRKVLVTGGRKYEYANDRVPEVLDAIHGVDPISLLIHGNYGATDLAAHAWAISRGVKPAPEDAEWTRYGPAAGPMRNQRMIDTHCPDLCVAFPGGPGTRDCASKMRKAGIPVRVVER